MITQLGQAGALPDIVQVGNEIDCRRDLVISGVDPGPRSFSWGGGSLALFDAGGSVLPAASEMLD